MKRSSTTSFFFNSRLRFNPASTFLGVTFDRTLFFSKHVSWLKAKFFPRLNVLRCIYVSSWSPAKESLSLRHKAFLQPILLCASPGWFPFLSVTNITKLERLHQAASRAISGCLSSSPIPLLLSEASPPPLQVTQTHFTLSCYERALHLPTIFFISGWPNLEWNQNSTYLPEKIFRSCSLLLGKALLACPPCPPRNLFSFTVESALSPNVLVLTPPPPSLSLVKVWLSLTLFLSPLTIRWCGQIALFLLAKTALVS